MFTSLGRIATALEAILLEMKEQSKLLKRIADELDGTNNKPVGIGAKHEPPTERSTHS